MAKIAIIGTGAMGSVYAGLLADAGHEVWAIDSWAEHVEAMRKNGLRVEGASGDHVGKVHASVPVSAQSGEGLETLKLQIEQALSTRSRTYRVRIPHTAGADVGWLYGHAEIINREEPDDEGQTYEVRVEPRHAHAFADRFGSRIQS